jgi:hypothetical protein
MHLCVAQHTTQWMLIAPLKWRMLGKRVPARHLIVNRVSEALL